MINVRVTLPTAGDLAVQLMLTVRPARLRRQRLDNELRKAAEQISPYARRHGTPKLPPWIINRQTGLFYRAWGRGIEKGANGAWVAQAVNNSQRAPFMRTGTQTMFPRPIWTEVIKTIKPVATRRIQVVLTKIKQTIS
jgi:hypothetical protein